MSTVSVIYDLIGRDSLSPALKKAGDSADGLHGRLSNLGKAAVLAGAAMAAGAVAIGVESVKSAVTFQASMERIHTQAGVAQSKIAGLSQGVLDLAGKVGQNPDSLAESFYHVASNMASMGATGPQMLNAVKIAAEGARVGGADLVDVTNALGAAIASGIPGVQNYQSAMGVLNATVGAGDMKMQDLADAMGTGFLSNVKLYGSTLNDVGAALATFGDNNIRGAEAGTQLRIAVQAIAVQAKTAGPALKELGLQVGELGKYQSLHGTVATIDLLSQHLKAAGIPATQYGQIITELFGKKAGSGIGVLIDQVDRLNSKQAVLSQGATKFGSEWQATQQTASQQFAMLRGGLDAVGIKIGLALLPPVTAFVSFLNKTAIPVVSAWAGKVSGLIPVDKIKKDVSEAEQWLKNLLGIKPAPIPIVAKPMMPKGIKNAADLFNLPRQGTVLAPVKLTLPKGAKSAADLLGLSQKPVLIPAKLVMPKGVKNASDLFSQRALDTVLVPLKPVLPRGVKNASDLFNVPSANPFKVPAPPAPKAPPSFIDTIMNAVKKIDWGQVFSNIISSAVTGAQKIGAAFLTLLGKINWTSMGKAFANVAVGLAVGLVVQLPMALISEAIHHPMDMLLFLSSIIPIGRVGGLILQIFDKIPFLGPLLKVFLGPLEKAGTMMESALGGILKKLFGPLGEKILAYFAKPQDWLVSKGESILLGLWYGAEDGLSFLLRWLGKINEWMAAPFIKAGKWLLKAGGDILGGLWGGAKMEWELEFAWLGKIGGWIGSVFAKAGSWLLSKGTDIIRGLWDGQKAQWAQAWSWVTKIGGWIGSAFAKAASWLLGHGRDVISGLWNGQKAQWAAAWSWITKIGGWIIGNFAKAGSWLTGHGGDIIRGLLGGISGAMRGIGGWIKSTIVDPIVGAVKSFFGIKSPSTVMAGLGSHLMSGLFKGMMSHDVTGMVKKIFGSMPNALGAIAQKGMVSLTNLPAKALSALGSLFGSGGSPLTGLGGLGAAAAAAAGGSAGAVQKLVQQMAAARGWTGAQWNALNAVEMREAGWNLNARNPSSGAYGIAQGITGPSWYDQWPGGNPSTAQGQAIGLLDYIAQRYGSPAAAWAHEQAFNWYAKGTPGARPGWAWVGEQGRELVNFHGGETVLSHGDSMRAAASGMAGYATGTLTAAERHAAAVEAAADRAEAAAAKRRASARTAEQNTALPVVDAYLSGTVTTLSKIAAEQSAAVKAIQKYYSGRPAAWAENVIAGQSRQLTGLVNKLSTLTSQHNAAASYQSSVASSLSGYGALSNLTVDPFQKGGGLAPQLQAKLAQLSKFAGALGQLRKAGLSASLIQQVVALGPDDGYTYAQAMLSGGSSVIKQINAADSAINAAAGSVAHSAAVAVYGSAVVDGFKSQQAALEKQMKSLGATMGREVARWLGVPASKLPHYGHGGKFAAGQLMVTGDRGPELAMFDRPGQILSPEQSAALGTRGGDGPLVGEMHVHHVPGFTTQADIENALTMASRQVRLARR